MRCSPGLVAEPTAEGDGGLAVKTHDISLVGELAFRGGIPLHERQAPRQ